MIIAVALAVSATAALAQPVPSAPGREPAGPLRQVDRDGDGRISLSEMQTRARERLARLDADRDGRVTLQEREAARERLRAERERRRTEREARRFARQDADRDGAISAAEVDAQVRARFARLDADRDGFVTREEMRAARQGGPGRHRRG